MAKIQKHAEFLDTLQSMITKEATAGTATGKPGADTHYTSVSKQTEHVDKNKEGKPENNPQEFKQEKSKDHSEPAKAHKSADEKSYLENKHEVIEKATDKEEGKETTEKAAPQATSTATPELAKVETHTEQKQEVNNEKKADEAPANLKLAELGNQLLAAINEMNKQATAGTATGKPGADTHYTSVSKETEHVDKNKEGKPENNPQEFKQEKSKDHSEPAKAHKSAEELELDKEASFELGRTFARAFLSTKVASEVNIYKEAGRRDFETLIATAAAELESEGKKHEKKESKKEQAIENLMHAKQAAESDEAQVKQAEEAGAQAFNDLIKQAQEEAQAAQYKQALDQHIAGIVAEKNAAEAKANELATKLAEKEAILNKQAEEAKLDAKFASWGNAVVEQVISRLKHESSN